jgi:MFS transporter, MHS family, citrate/tricarballylate:H+ symporter
MLYAAVALMGFLLSLGLPAIMAQVGESLPLNMRSGGIGVIYAVAIAVFGGTTSFIVTWLTAVTGSPLAPAFYMCGALALGVLSMLVMRETAPVKTSR